MDYPLHFGRQTWKPRKDGELTIFLPPNPRRGMPFHADFSFVPPWVDEEEGSSEHRTMYLTLDGYFPEGRHWHELEGVSVEARELAPPCDHALWPDIQEPEIRIWSSGQGAGSIHTHAKDGWETRVSVEEFAADDAYVIICSVEVFFPSERARKAMSEMWFRGFFGGEDFGDLEREKVLDEGWRFAWRGRLALEFVSCTVPVNAVPIAFAQEMAGRELGMKEFGYCRVNGGNADGTYKPEDGVSERGRLVLLAPMSEYFKQWQRQEKAARKKREQEEKDK